MAIRDFELLLGHVHAKHISRLPDHLRQRIAVPARTASQIENPCPFKQLGAHQTTAIVAGHDLIVNIGQCIAQIARHLSVSATGICLKVSRVLQHLAVILFYRIFHLSQISFTGVTAR